MTGLSFYQLRSLNVERAKLWHPGFPGDDTWTLADWSNAMCGEAGEAANIVKKIRRWETNLHGADQKTIGELVPLLADEIADVVCYLDLLAAKAAINMGMA